MSELILAADVSGTHTTIGLFRRTGARPEQLRIVRKPTQQYAFNTLVQEELAAAQRGFGPVTKACFAVAGPVAEHNGTRHIRMTNADQTVDEAELLARTGLKRILLLNDFQAIGYATGIAAENEHKVIQTGTEGHGQRACIGAGTDLGKCILCKQGAHYRALDTEGNAADFAPYDEEDAALLKHIAETEELTHPVTEGMLLSGKGLERIYGFLQREHHGVPERLDAKTITASRTTNACSAETVARFVRYLGRAGKNYVLNTGAWNGLFIAGGIASHIADAFGDSFRKEFTASERFGTLLAHVPVTLILNYDLGTIGAAYALEVEL